MRILGVEFAPLSTPLERRVQVLPLSPTNSKQNGSVIFSSSFAMSASIVDNSFINENLNSYIKISKNCETGKSYLYLIF